MTERPRWLILIRSKPYICEKAASGIDAVLACGAFGQSVSVIFEGNGLEVLCAEQRPPVGQRNLFKQVTSFPLYDVHTVFAVAECTAIERRFAGKAPADLRIKAIGLDELQRQISSATHVLSF